MEIFLSLSMPWPCVRLLVLGSAFGCGFTKEMQWCKKFIGLEEFGGEILEQVQQENLERHEPEE